MSYSQDGRWYWNGQEWQPVVSPGPAWARPYWPLDARATAATALVAAACLGMALLALSNALLDAVQDPNSPLALAIGLVGFVGLFPFAAGGIGAAIAVPIWMHLAYRNLPALGARGLHMSPGLAAGGWFIPLGNLVIPFLVVRELWIRSGDDARPPWWVGLWLALWIAPLPLLILVAALLYAGLPPTGLAVGAFTAVFYLDLVTMGIVLILVVQAISRRQSASYARLSGG